ncbi:hypothetical protein MtrunA17_Chr1g0207791 [Medicago truncatula]|uniref:Plant basic secretory protein (BSP) family protein n=1 Tax=Medicago truncatula TaxID=3880 RepID=A0A396JV94_MEDTR|nr:hypothetical protein MtrunA17_Chr1g0207791 [Medicago truncatula]
MDQKHLKNVLFFLLALAAAHCAKAINYVVSNNAEASTGAARFDKEIVGVIIENIDGLAFASNDIIHISAGYIEKYREDVKKEIAGLIYHEMAHILQWDGNGKAPSGLTEGIADFMRMKAGYASDLWSPAGVGDQWDQGYEVTAHFLHYCDNLKNGFVADLNKKLKTDYSESYFNDLLGKPVAQLWSDYKAMYNN